MALRATAARATRRTTRQARSLRTAKRATCRTPSQRRRLARRRATTSRTTSSSDRRCLRLRTSKAGSLHHHGLFVRPSFLCGDCTIDEKFASLLPLSGSPGLLTHRLLWILDLPSMFICALLNGYLCVVDWIPRCRMRPVVCRYLCILLEHAIHPCFSFLVRVDRQMLPSAVGKE